MNNDDKIKVFQNEIDSLKRQQTNCKHDWSEPKFDPEQISVQDDRSGYETHGIDRWPIPSFHEESKDRWSRACKECGYKEYTYNQEPVITERKPKF